MLRWLKSQRFIMSIKETGDFMLTDPKLRSQVDQLWDKLWTGGLSNPLDAIEQFSYLLFLKRLDEN